MPPRSRFAWVVGIAAVVVVAAISIQGARPDAPGARGLKAGTQLPPFAVPLATSDIVCDDDSDPCDANVARAAGQGDAGHRPACAVRGPTVLNVCQINERGPLVLGLVASRAASCTHDFDRLATIARGRPGLQVAAVVIGGSLADVRAVIRERGWRHPVGWDRDGALAALYGVAVCPYVTVVRAGGTVQGTLAGPFSGAELERLADAAIAGSRAARFTP